MTLLDDARAVLATGPVCDACLGRRFAALSHGLANVERGRALRVALALNDDEPLEAVEPAECWVCDGRSGAADAWADRAADALDGLEFDTYLVGTRPPTLLEENEALLLEETGIPAERGEPFNSDFNREVGKRLGDRVGATVDFERPDVVVLCDLGGDRVEVTANPAFVYGRYRKLERGISQTTITCDRCGGSGTVWEAGKSRECPDCGGVGAATERSVEGIVAPPILDAMEGSGAVFHAAGREYDDALMLGAGRPFVVEVKAPRRRTPDLDALAGAIDRAGDGAVEVRDLALAPPGSVERVTSTPYRQRFRLELAFEAPVSGSAFEAALEALDGATVHQRYRGGTGRERVRTLHGVDGALLDSRSAQVELGVEAGVDVAAIATGEDGETDPTLAALLDVAVTVTSLDVVAVESLGEPFGLPAVRDGD